MILGASARVLRETHVVAPAPASAEGPQWLSRVRVSVQLRDTDSAAFVVWPFPNAGGHRNRWEIAVSTVIPGGLDVRAMLAAVGYQHDGSPVLELPVVGVVGSFEELLLEHSWEHMPDAVNADLEYLGTKYGSEYGFVLGKVPDTGTYELEWRWFGEQPFVFGCTRSAMHDAALNVVVANHTRVLWANPSGSDARGPRARTVRAAERLEALQTKAMAPLTCLVAARMPPERRRNDDVTAEACVQQRPEPEPSVCCVA